MSLAKYREDRYQMLLYKMQADKQRDRQLCFVHFKAISKFSKLKDQKLAAIRTVNQYLH